MKKKCHCFEDVTCHFNRKIDTLTKISYQFDYKIINFDYEIIHIDYGSYSFNITYDFNMKLSIS